MRNRGMKQIRVTRHQKPEGSIHGISDLYVISTLVAGNWYLVARSQNFCASTKGVLVE